MSHVRNMRTRKETRNKSRKAKENENAAERKARVSRALFQVRSLGAEHATEEECQSLWQKKEMVEGGKQGIRGGVQG